jgi:hypothetical protein
MNRRCLNPPTRNRQMEYMNSSYLINQYILKQRPTLQLTTTQHHNIKTNVQTRVINSNSSWATSTRLNETLQNKTATKLH